MKKKKTNKNKTTEINHFTWIICDLSSDISTTALWLWGQSNNKQHSNPLTDQVIIGVLGLEHSCDILQVVRVNLFGATPREGHGDDALCDICEVEFVSLLHLHLWKLPVENQITANVKLDELFFFFCLSFCRNHSCMSTVRWPDLGQYLTTKVLRFSHCIQVSYRYFQYRLNNSDLFTKYNRLLQKHSTKIYSYQFLPLRMI